MGCCNVLGNMNMLYRYICTCIHNIIEYQYLYESQDGVDDMSARGIGIEIVLKQWKQTVALISPALRSAGGSSCSTWCCRLPAGSK